MNAMYVFSIELNYIGGFNCRAKKFHCLRNLVFLRARNGLPNNYFGAYLASKLLKLTNYAFAT